MIKFEDVSAVYHVKGNGEFKALDEINLHIKHGEFVSLVGPSGAGKSTLLKLLTHELKPTEGVVTVEGMNLNDLPQSEVPYLRRKIGTVYQDFKLLSNKTTFENVAFAMEVCGVEPEEIAEDVPKVLGIVGMADKMNNFPHQLSGGEKQRLAVARALIHRPKVILADEPTGNLDMVNTYDVVKLLTKINELGTTIILATHDHEVVNAIGRRVITMDTGKIVRDQMEQGKYVI
ncbi:MAG: Cell division ATP-binding protein FtsE [Candidatus Yanofskybacteria bacterium GW2011_GWA1_44_21]|uniref:Cell division ATP-binding protein FtsE n=2 Tax=Candidatus Yanofskyibacteriota TaxID=1752733 RepID=A0A1F8H0H2_9BACT|nr:MAG: Cell division ATP-binding protein FtsE [Candidatus Yanofskybacteria bacterium GW2011_GWA2_44_10]KKT50877.1 MAG: Cell division ATP-binding protein FtsE [Candidatus Yanofskybacteria bacterium GW2011_GWA1_44_21]KKT90449.1 MAG: Cell division ATP-binding protein FtsE [Candidatus Yanofskybacteria bacterium GW2011_GWB1_45_11]OGN02299.1 MAG: cell division ATP-binding protein FtsE [Candidatus Yanofskybacteria bacterium RIFCSPHIGHO2_01_FULL_44_110b]OGN14257.1 MAG: cell division ATP-binding protei